MKRSRSENDEFHDLNPLPKSPRIGSPLSIHERLAVLKGGRDDAERALQALSISSPSKARSWLPSRSIPHDVVSSIHGGNPSWALGALRDELGLIEGSEEVGWEPMILVGQLGKEPTPADFAWASKTFDDVLDGTPPSWDALSHYSQWVVTSGVLLRLIHGSAEETSQLVANQLLSSAAWINLISPARAAAISRAVLEHDGSALPLHVQGQLLVLVRLIELGSWIPVRELAYYLPEDYDSLRRLIMEIGESNYPSDQSNYYSYHGWDRRYLKGGEWVAFAGVLKAARGTEAQDLNRTFELRDKQIVVWTPLALGRSPAPDWGDENRLPLILEWSDALVSDKMKRTEEFDAWSDDAVCIAWTDDEDKQHRTVVNLRSGAVHHLDQECSDRQSSIFRLGTGRNLIAEIVDGSRVKMTEYDPRAPDSPVASSWVEIDEDVRDGYRLYFHLTDDDGGLEVGDSYNRRQTLPRPSAPIVPGHGPRELNSGSWQTVGGAGALCFNCTYMKNVDERHEFVKREIEFDLERTGKGRRLALALKQDDTKLLAKLATMYTVDELRGLVWADFRFVLLCPYELDLVRETLVSIIGQDWWRDFLRDHSGPWILDQLKIEDDRLVKLLMTNIRQAWTYVGLTVKDLVFPKRSIGPWILDVEDEEATLSSLVRKYRIPLRIDNKLPFGLTPLAAAIQYNSLGAVMAMVKLGSRVSYDGFNAAVAFARGVKASEAIVDYLKHC